MTSYGRGYRINLLWLTAMIHRISGLALAAFLPLHFLVLGLAIRDSERLDGFFHWTERPLVKSAETLLIFLFTVHMFGGLRLLVVENMNWHDGQKQLATLAVGISAIISFVFLARVF
jgi:fumarate reductase subunit D